MKVHIILIISLLILGWSLQKENPMKHNTTIKSIDVLLMILTILLIIPFSYPLAIIIALRTIYNIAPYILLWVKEFDFIISEFRHLYTIDRVKPLFDKRGGIFIANHASGCFNDFIGACAIGSENRILVVNPGPLGSNGIPQYSDKYVCVINRSEGKTGYQAMKDLMRKHIMQNDKSLVVFGENLKLKTSKWKMAPIRSGVVRLCWEMNIPIYGMWIDWPCQFPISFRSDERRLEIREWIIHESPGDFSSFDELLLFVNNNYNKFINC